MNRSDLVALARRLAATLNAYESHTLQAVDDAEAGIHVKGHEDLRVCSDESEHDPWGIVHSWPLYSAKDKARRGDLHSTARDELLTGAEVAVLADGDERVVVRYVATDHRWVVDEQALVAPRP